MTVVINRNFDAETVGTLPSGLENIVGTWQVATNNAVSAPNGLRCVSNASEDVVFDRSGPAARLIAMSYKQILKVSVTDSGRMHLMHALLRTPGAGGFTDGYWVAFSVRLAFIDVAILRRNASVNTLLFSDRIFTTFADSDIISVKAVIEEAVGDPTSDVVKVYYNFNAPATTLRAQSSVVPTGNQPPAGHVGFYLDKEYHQADLTIDDMIVEVFGLNPPTITSHPSSTTVPTGDLATFSVAHDGTGPFTYQWQRSISGGAFSDMAGQVSTTLSFTTVAGDTGNQYRCVVTGSVAPAATSNAATLTVDNTPAGVVTGVSGAATGGTTGTITWTAGSPAGTSYNVAVETPSGAGNWSTPAGVRTGTSFAATGLIGATEYRPRIQAVNGAGTSAWVVGTAFSTDNVGTGGGSLDLSVLDTTSPVLSASTVTGGEEVASATATSSEAGTLYWQVTASATPLSIPASPGAMSGWTSRALTVGVNSWSLGAQSVGTGKYLHLCAQDAEATPNRTTPDLVVGPFTVTAIPIPAVAPSITTQPQAQTVVEGQQATFSVVAAGTAPFTYQWRRGGVAISGAVSSTYSRTTVDGDNAAVFSVVVTNGAGTVTSANAVLTVTPSTQGGVISNKYEILIPNGQGTRDRKVIERMRGDSYADEFSIKVVETGLPLNIVGCSFLMTLDPQSSPKTSSNNLYQLTGVIVSASQGKVSFAPSSVQANLLGSFYYDIQMVDGQGGKRTIDVGEYLYKQDITK